MPWPSCPRRLLRSFACAHTTVLGSSTATAHIDMPHSLWTAALGMNRSKPPLAFSVWAHSVRYSFSSSKRVVCLPLEATTVERRRRGDKRHHHNAGLQKSSGRKPWHSPTTFGGHRTSLAFCFFFFLQSESQPVTSQCLSMESFARSGARLKQTFLA